jgi:hypothetical protein
MSSRIRVAFLLALLGQLAHASGGCPVTLISGTGDSDSISVTFRNTGKVPVRDLEFNCKLLGDRSHKTETFPCNERNGLFFPGMDYTVTYPHRPRAMGQIRVSLRSAGFADGYIWRPLQEASCRVLRIALQKKK